MANPFIAHSIPFQFVDEVGLIREPNAELRYANWDDDAFLVSRDNSQGFPDREPLKPQPAPDECRIVFIGDSYVAAREVPIADKFHVRLEEMAARHLPHLRIATQAYGIRATGQINQLPLYDEYARHLNPKLVILAFYLNDFGDNLPALQSLMQGSDPDRLPYMSAYKDANGDLKLRPPNPEYWRFSLPKPPKTWRKSAWEKLARASYFAKWLDTKNLTGWALAGIAAIRPQTDAPAAPEPHIIARANILASRPCYSTLLDDWQVPISRNSLSTGLPFKENRLPPIFQDALQYTAFGIDQFKQRADRDDVALAILAATRDMGTRGDPQFDRLTAIAQPRAIPIISDYDYIVKQGYHPDAALWRHDSHWNANGHQWAAEAILEWLKANQHVCD